MPISRAPDLLPYYGYLTNTALIPTSSPSQDLLSLTTGGFDWVEIPHYQRGISWDINAVVDNFLSSSSVLLGNVILSEFPISGRFEHVPGRYTNYVVLVDGLQRLAVGTMLLNSLHPLVLTQSPARPGDAAFFRGLAARVRDLAPVYQHNDAAFRSHPRRAISEQYTNLADDIDRYVRDSLQRGEAESLADLVVPTLLEKQIAIDKYFNFTSPLELMNTFLGLNTVRVDLGPVDFLRAYLVEQATSASWPAQDIEEMENEFTDIFTENERPDSELLPFVAVILKSIRANRATQVFKTWRTGLLKQEVDDFLEFVKDFKDCHGTNAYFDEIRSCGSIPFAALLIHYYRQYVQHGGTKPSFLVGADGENAELHMFLLATYRVLLDGRIGRTRVYVERLLAGSIQSLEVAANQMSSQFVGEDLSSNVDREWLRASLNRVDRTRARRVFNAMLLPERSNGWGTQTLDRLQYGRRSQQYHIDHLIPESMKVVNSPGSSEMETIRNFAPLRTNQNRLAKATSCSMKLNPDGLYDRELQNHKYHPFCAWLVEEHAPGLGAQLDDQRYLEPNQNPAIGDGRVDFISDYLLPRL